MNTTIDKDNKMEGLHTGHSETDGHTDNDSESNNDKNDDVDDKETSDEPRGGEHEHLLLEDGGSIERNGEKSCSSSVLLNTTTTTTTNISCHRDQLQHDQKKDGNQQEEQEATTRNNGSINESPAATVEGAVLRSTTCSSNDRDTNKQEFYPSRHQQEGKGDHDDQGDNENGENDKSKNHDSTATTTTTTTTTPHLNTLKQSHKNTTTTPLRSMPSLMDNDDENDESDDCGNDNAEKPSTRIPPSNIPKKNDQMKPEETRQNLIVTPASTGTTLSNKDKRRKLSSPEYFYTPLNNHSITEDHQLDFTSSISNDKEDHDGRHNNIHPRRHTLGTTNTTNRTWEDFVKRGTRLKTFLDDAMNRVATGFGSTTPQKSSTESMTYQNHSGSKRPLSAINGEDDDDDDNESDTNQQSNSYPTNENNNNIIDKHAADIARQATTEVMILKQKLKEAEAEAAAMAATNATLREAATASSERLDRTVEALRIAGTNAANARAEADASEAQTASLALQLQSLKGVVDETKRASQTLYEEHEQVSSAARSIEAKLLQRESENFRMRKDQKRMVDEQTILLDQQGVLEKERTKLKKDLKQQTDELSRLQKTIEEREAIELARTDRSYRIEKELRETRTMLVEATAATADTEVTTSLLNDTIQELQRENKSLHEKIQHLQNKARNQYTTHTESIQIAEGGAQKLRIKVAANEEDIQRLRLDRNDGEKQISQLKSRINTLERRLKDASTLGPPSSSMDTGEGTSTETATSTSTSNTVAGAMDTNRNSIAIGGGGRKSIGFSIPPLRSTVKTATAATPNATTTTSLLGENKENIPRGGKNSRTTHGKCCICYKDAVGLMKSCQCGKKGCDKRAHAMCLGTFNKAGPSVSHPGTPAPRLPVVLCSNLQH